ncbi:MAG TPA: hypothetical protein P5081_03335, partial [Phycisphaerae bacterium]|nr:hypothetical protein [Phycisphaerae bacterium]
MILRKVIRLALLAFVAVSLGYYTYTLIRIPDNAIRGGGTPTIPAVAGAGADSRPVAQEDVTTSEPGRQVIAYYFHNTQRCKTCLAIEERSKSALDEAFAPAMESGALVWRAINMETPPN